MSDLAQEILAKRFTTSRLREGYALDEVDDFLDRAVAAVRAGDDLAPLVDGALFRTVRFTEGYDMKEVDDFLDELTTRGPAAGSPTVGSPTVGSPTVPPTPATAQPPAPSASSRGR